MISDEDLILYHYRDGLDANERARIGAALSDSPELAQRLQRLVARLDAVAATPEVPVPAQAMQRWRAALDRATDAQTTRAVTAIRPRRPAYMPWLAAAAVLVISLVAILQLTRQPRQPDQTAQVTPPATAAPTEPSAYERGLESHLASTEQQLASLENATPEERARLIETIIDQNRLYALAADRAGEPQLARVLRAFSPVLESLQKEGGDTSGSVARLAFELRVMQGRLAAGTTPHTTSTTL